MKKPIAVMGISNNMSLNIYEVNEPEDYVLVGYNNEKPTKADIWHDEKGAGFILDEEMLYFDEFIRTDI